ncbi:unnamed protein product [Microthlaspi erraticum]|uniref:F-box associated beta-propeller type 3 domain-containing protein n=1 Tax=Microthlaspi erraticum TaxID=1685480 RepID=A0A6D2KCF0_9BRAS|nr:unnamed protein product [Microthlaspi erraticum]
MKNLEQQFSENLSVTSIDETQSSKPFWGYILCRPDFTELFLTKSSTRPRILFTVEVKGKLLFYSSPQPQNPDDNSTLVATRYDTSFPKYVPSDRCSTVCGLALLHSYIKRQGRVFCNPVTGEFITLPKLLLKDKSTLPQVKAKSSNPNTEAKARISRICLGYDPISKQFKVLCVISSRGGGPNTHQVLTLESGKRLWRRIECQFHFTESHRMFDEICINGVLYFRAKMRQSSVIVCFDVRSEKFSFINLDKDMGGKKGYYACGEMILFKGDIVFLSFPYDDRSKLYFVYFFNPERKTFARVNVQGFEEFENRLKLSLRVPMRLFSDENIQLL